MAIHTPADVDTAHVAASHREPCVRKRDEECQIAKPEVRPHPAQIGSLRPAHSAQQIRHRKPRPEERYPRPIR